jgi:hypothetical protein
VPSTAAWPTATGTARRTGTTTGFARPEDDSLQQPARGESAGAEPRVRSVRDGGTTDRKRRRLGEDSPSTPAPEPRRMIAGAVYIAGGPSRR